MGDEYEFGIILDSARRGNAAETDAIAKMCMAHPYYLISSLAESEADVGPLMCDTFRHVFLNLDVITQRVGLQNWVDTLAVRKCIESLSARHADLYAPLADAETDSDLTLQDLEAERSPFNPVKYASLIPSVNDGKKLIAGVMSELDMDQRILLVLFYMQDLTLLEIAGDLKFKWKRVRARLIPVREAICAALPNVPPAARAAMFTWLARKEQDSAEVPADVAEAVLAAARAASKEYAAADRAPKTKKVSFLDLFRKKKD
jgi:DNA-directed RNA polymerase specialized sigma24 family protein